ncbi:MAG: PHP-associated domain-containing protein [Chloroflexota bacterium]
MWLTFNNLFSPGNKANAGWSKADLHLHTSCSDGWMTPAETVDIIAGQTPLTVIAITDHDTTDGAFWASEYARRHHPELEVIIGQEITTGEGDVLGLFLKSTLPRFATAAQAIEAIHQQEGLAVAPHPFTYGLAMESVGPAILRLPFDAVEARHGCPLSSPSNVITALVNRFSQRLPALGNSDAHIPYAAGQAFTWFPGRTGADLYRAIKNNTVRPGGTTWQLPALLRQLAVIAERGWVSYPGNPELQHFKG